MKKFSKSLAVALIITGVTVGVISGCAKKETPEGFFSQAQQSLAKDDSKAAIIQLKNAIQLRPDYVEAHYELGNLYLNSGEVALAEKELRKAVTLNMDRAKVLPLLARALLMQGQFQKVLDETPLQGDNKVQASAEILSSRGHALVALGRRDDGQSAFEQALEKQPGFSDALLGQARLAVMDHQLDKAVGLIERALIAAPKSVEAWVMKGDVQRLVPNDAAAIASYQKALEIQPDNMLARLNLGAAQVATANYDAAEKNIERVRKVAPNNPMVNYIKALLEYRQAHYTAARDALQQVLKVAPTHMPSVLLSGLTEYVLANYEQAQQHLGAVLGKAPDNLQARKLMAATQIKTRQFQQALQTLEPGLRQAPDDGALLQLAGEASLQTNEFAKATEYFQKASTLDPKNTGKRTGLGLSRLAAGDSEQAIADLTAAAALDASNFRADILLIMSHLGRNEPDQALVALQSLQTKQPNNPLTYNLKGAVYTSKKDYAAARAEFERALSLQPDYFPAAANLARLDLQDKQPLAARNRYEGLLKKNPNHVQAMLAIAELIAITGGKQEEVLGWLQRANKANPKAARPLLMLSRHYLQTGDANKALSSAHEAQPLDPDNAEILDVLGAAQLAANENSQALSTYSRLVTLQPKSPLALFRLATAQNAMGSFAAASLSLKKALELKPDYLEAKVLLVLLELRAGQHDEALQRTQDIQAQASLSPIGYALEGDIRLGEKNYDEAVVLYEKAYGLNKHGQLAIKIHAAHSLAGNPEQGEVRLQDWLQGHPDDAVVRLYLADAQLKAAKYPAAIQHYQLILKGQPENIVALNNLAWAAQQNKDPRAIEYAEKAYALKPDNAAVVDTLGWMLVEQDKLPRGLELLQKAVSLAPDMPEIRYHLVQALLKSGDKLTAREELERVLSGGAKFPQEAEAAELLKTLQN